MLSKHNKLIFFIKILIFSLNRLYGSYEVLEGGYLCCSLMDLTGNFILNCY
jgi:hypothetical protein